MMYRRTATGATIIANAATGLAWHIPSSTYVNVLTSTPGLLDDTTIRDLSDTHFRTLSMLITQGTNGAGNAKIDQLSQ